MAMKKWLFCSKELARVFFFVFTKLVDNLQPLRLDICDPNIFLDFCFPGKVAELILLLTLQNSVIGKQIGRNWMLMHVTLLSSSIFHTAATAPQILKKKKQAGTKTALKVVCN